MAEIQPFNMFAAVAPIYQARDNRIQQQHENAFRERGFQADQQYRAQTMDLQRQGMGMERERLDMAREAARRASEEAARKLSADELAAEAEQSRQLAETATKLASAGQWGALTNLLQSEGMPVQQVTPEMWPQLQEMFAGSIEGAMGVLSGMPEPYKPQSSPGKVQADINAGMLPEGTPLQGGGTSLAVGPDGSVQFSQGGAPVKLTEQQGKYMLFGSMMDATMPIIDGLEERFNPGNLPDNLASRAGWGGNYVKSEEMRQYEAAAAAWAEGVLRLQTGAAATEPEIQRVVKTYFAQPGDSAQTIRFKRDLRTRYAEAIGAASGGLIEPGGGNNTSPPPTVAPPAAPEAPPETLRGDRRDRRGGGVPDVSQMSDEELEAIINGG